MGTLNTKAIRDQLSVFFSNIKNLTSISHESVNVQKLIPNGTQTTFFYFKNSLKMLFITLVKKSDGHNEIVLNKSERLNG